MGKPGLWCQAHRVHQVRTTFRRLQPFPRMIFGPWATLSRDGSSCSHWSSIIMALLLTTAVTCDTSRLVGRSGKLPIPASVHALLLKEHAVSVRSPRAYCALQAPCPVLGGRYTAVGHSPSAAIAT